MKVAILTDEADARNGYLNVMTRVADLSKVPGGALRAATGEAVCPPVEFALVPDLLDFGEAVFPGEADEVFVPGTHEWVDPEAVDRYLAAWVGLLAVGGTIAVGGIDFVQVADRLSRDRLTEKAANQATFGAAGAKRACYSAASVREALEALGLVVERAGVDGIRYMVVAKRVK